MSQKRTDSEITRWPPGEAERCRPHGHSRGWVQPPSEEGAAGQCVGHKHKRERPRGTLGGGHRSGDSFLQEQTPKSSISPTFWSLHDLKCSLKEGMWRQASVTAPHGSGRSDVAPGETALGSEEDQAETYSYFSPSRRDAFSHAVLPTISCPREHALGCLSSQPPRRPAPGAESGHGSPTVPSSPPRARGPDTLPVGGGTCPAEARLCGGLLPLF